MEGGGGRAAGANGFLKDRDGGQKLRKATEGRLDKKKRKPRIANYTRRWECQGQTDRKGRPGKAAGGKRNPSRIKGVFSVKPGSA